MQLLEWADDEYLGGNDGFAIAACRYAPGRPNQFGLYWRIVVSGEIATLYANQTELWRTAPKTIDPLEAAKLLANLLQSDIGVKP